MFDIGFRELLLIAIVALLVVGPKRLPELIRDLGALYNRVQGFIRQMQADFRQVWHDYDDQKTWESLQKQTKPNDKPHINSATDD